MLHFSESQFAIEVPPVPQVSPIESAALQLYQPYADVWDIADRLYGKLRNRYECTGMAERRPVQAEYLVLRGMTQAIYSPILHLIEVEATKQLLPYWQGERPLEEVIALESPETGAVYEKSDEEFDEDWAAVAQAAGAWYLTATEAVLQRIEADPHHPFRGLWELHAAVFPEFARCERLVRDYQRNDNPRIDIGSQQSASIGTVKRNAQPYIDLLPGRPGLLNGAETLLRIAESLGWVASTNRSKSKRLQEAAQAAIASVQSDASVRACPYAGAQHTSEGIVILPGVHKEVWNDASLSSGPWNPPGYCSAVFELPAASFEDRWAIEALYTQQEKYAGKVERLIRRPHGAARTAELRVINLGLLAIAARTQRKANERLIIPT